MLVRRKGVSESQVDQFGWDGGKVEDVVVSSAELECQGRVLCALKAVCSQQRLQDITHSVVLGIAAHHSRVCPLHRR